MSAKKKETGGEIRYMRVKPATNVLFSLVFILLALICFMPALLVLIVYMLVKPYKEATKLSTKV